MEQGCLNIYSIHETNQAPLSKWLWKFGTEDQALWRRVVAVKYGVGRNGWSSGTSSRPYVVACGKAFANPRSCFLDLFTSRSTNVIGCNFGMILGVLESLYVTYFRHFIICLLASGGQ